MAASIIITKARLGQLTRLYNILEPAKLAQLLYLYCQHGRGGGLAAASLPFGQLACFLSLRRIKVFLIPVFGILFADIYLVFHSVVVSICLL